MLLPAGLACRHSLVNRVCGRHFPPHPKHNVSGAQENATRTRGRKPTWRRAAETTGKCARARPRGRCKGWAETARELLSGSSTKINQNSATVVKILLFNMNLEQDCRLFNPPFLKKKTNRKNIYQNKMIFLALHHQLLLFDQNKMSTAVYSFNT